MNKPEEQIERFTRAHLRIVKEALKHTNKTGYLSFKVDKNSYLIDGSFEFVQGDFPKEEFNFYDTKPVALPPGVEVKDAFYIYLSVQGPEGSRLNIRKLILEVNQ